MADQSLLQYLSLALLAIRVKENISPPPYHNTKSSRYHAKAITNVIDWTEFNYATIMEQYGDILNSKQIRSDPFGSPAQPIRAEPVFHARYFELVNQRVRRALRAGFEELAHKLQQLNLTPITIDSGGSAACIDGFRPDIALFVVGQNCTDTANRAPGSLKVSWKWRSDYRHSQDDYFVGQYKQVLSQVNFYMRQHNSRYGFVLTDAELVAIKRLDDDGPSGGRLAVSSSVPWTNGGSQNQQLTVLLGMWYLGMLAADETYWNLPHTELPPNGNIISLDGNSKTTAAQLSMNPSSPSKRETDFNPSHIQILRELSYTPAFSIYLILNLSDGGKYILKIYHNRGDPGVWNGRDLNRFRCEMNAYQKLRDCGVCERGFVPKFYGYAGEFDIAAVAAIISPPYVIEYFTDNEEFKPHAIFLEYFPNAEKLNCVNYPDDLYSRQAKMGIEEIHKAGVLHGAIYSKSLLLVRGDENEEDRLVWVGFDVATTFSESGHQTEEIVTLCGQEAMRVQELGGLIRQDQIEGLPPYDAIYSG